jgi:enterochelin esterase-like enzyme
VLYLLHGAGGNENEWLHLGGVRETMDALIARKADPADGRGDARPHPGLVDGRCAREGRDRLLKEVLPHAEGHYRIDAVRANRLVAGLSAGGHGALNLALKHPQLFAAAAILSPAIYDPCHPAHSAATRNHPFQKDGRFDPALWQSLLYTRYIEATRPAS